MLNGFQFTSDDERFELRKTFDDGIVQYYSVWRVGKANAWLERLVDDNTQLHFARVTVAPSGMTLDGKNPEEPHTTWQYSN